MENIPGALLSILLITVGSILPVIVGFVVVKVFRFFKPKVDDNPVGIDSIIENKGDSFATILIVGWILCLPVYYLIYDSGVFFGG